MTKDRNNGENKLDGLTLEDLYASVPARNEAVRPLPVEQGLVLEVPLREPTGGWKLLHWLAPMPSHHRVFLDPLGASVFNQCDGQMNVRALIDWFAAQHKLSFHESRLSIMTYLKTLIRRGAVVVAVGGHA